MKTLSQHIEEKLVVNKDYKDPVNHNKINLREYCWDNDHLGLIGNEDMFDFFYDWLTKEGNKISKNELISLRSSSYLMAIDKLDKKIIMFVQSFGIKFNTIEIQWRPSNNKNERLTFRCYDDCSSTRIWPYNSNNAFNTSIECYKIDEKLYEEVLEIFDKHWYR